MKKKNLKLLVLIVIFILGIVYPNVTSAIDVGYKDPFSYSQDGSQGSFYPTSGTSQYNNKSKKETVSNFDFTSLKNQEIDVVTGATIPKTSQILNSTSFEGGYHEYRDENKKSSVFTKKIVKPTKNPNIFEIQLDVIGGKKENKEKIDIAFVLDKSGSMNKDIYGRNGSPSRWRVLNDSFNYFTDSFVRNSNYDVNFAMSSFASTPAVDYWGRPTNTHLPTVELARYTNGDYFSNNLTSMKNHPLLKNQPTGGTPTFLGIDGGMELLVNKGNPNREDARKYLIFITDGLPSFDLNNFGYQKYNGLVDTQQYSTNSNKIYQYLLTDFDKFNGTGVEGSTNYKNLFNYAAKKYNSYPEIKKYSIGIGYQADQYTNVLNAVGPDGSYKVKENIETELSKVLMTIQSQIIDSVASISKGHIIDEMSDYVTLLPETINSYQLKLEDNSIQSTPVKNGNVDEYAKKAIVKTENNQINVSNLTLSGDQHSSNGYRLTYQVELKPEFRNGFFYPANQPTFIYDENNPKGVGFAVPSIKNNLHDISVEKIWQGNQSIKPDISFTLEANSKKVDQITLTDGQLSHVFQNKPILDDFGEPIDYKIKETIDYTSTDLPVMYNSTVSGDHLSGFKVTNRPIGKFEASKLASKKNLAPGEIFEYKIIVKNIINGSVLSNLKVEDTMPDGIEIVGKLKMDGKDVGTFNPKKLEVIIPKLIGEQMVTITFDAKVKQDSVEGNKINIAKITNPEDPENPQKPPAEVEVHRETNLLIRKTDLEGNAHLKGAKFNLYKRVDNKEINQGNFESDINGQIKILGLKTGSYVLKETKPPTGYQSLGSPINIELDSKGNLSLVNSVNGLVSLTQRENIFELVVKNEPVRGILPKTGGFGYGKSIILAGLLILISFILTVYFLYHRKKGWSK